MRMAADEAARNAQIALSATDIGTRRMLQYRIQNKRVLPKQELVATCDPWAPQVHTAIVAIEADKVFGPDPHTGQTGISYSDRLYDKNGLFFAIVDPRRLLDPDNFANVTPADIEDMAKWDDIPLPRVIDAIKAAYHRPEPMVLTVNAGDCVKVTWLNAMQRGPGSIGLDDAPGDARMPGITSLNVDLSWSGNEAMENTPLELKGGDAASDLTPSARLAVALPLPILNKTYSYGRPIGGNPIWSASGNPEGPAGNVTLRISDNDPRYYRTRAAQIEKFQFYAGFAVARTEFMQPWLTSSISPENLFWLAGLRDRLPKGIGKQILDLKSEVTVDSMLDEITRLAADYTGAYAEFSKALGGGGITFQLTPPIAVATLDELEYVPLSLSGEYANSDLATFARSRISYQSGQFVHMVRLRETKSNDAKLDQLVDLETALQFGLSRKALTSEQIKTLIPRLAQIDAKLLAQINELAMRPGHAGLFEILERVKVNFIPYAFGALPVKSHADMIGHPSHGLIGAIVVVPQSADISDRPDKSDIRAPKIRFAPPAQNPIGSLTLARSCTLFPIISGNDALLDTPARIPDACSAHVIAPRLTDTPLYGAYLPTRDTDGGRHELRQFTLFWQDGLNLRDTKTGDIHDAGNGNEMLVADCKVCNDSYDLGEEGVSYLAEPFHIRLQRLGLNPAPQGIESHYNLNAFEFGPNFFRLTLPQDLDGLPPMPVLRARDGEEVVIHVLHPGGRARQRAFVTIGQDYDDLFPGFGFPHSALVAPGKAVPAALSRKVRTGCYLWFDGPTQLRAGGVWGLLDVVSADDFDKQGSSCRFETDKS